MDEFSDFYSEGIERTMCTAADNKSNKLFDS